MKFIRITNIHHKRIALIRGPMSMTAKLNEILNIYFQEKGGLIEREKLEKSSNKLLPPLPTTKRKKGMCNKMKVLLSNLDYIHTSNETLL